MLNDEQRAKDASNLQKEILSALPSTLNGNTSNKGATWAEASKELLALEEKRETATQLLQTHFKKPDPKMDDPNASENHTLKTLGMRAQPIVITEPSDLSKTSINTNNGNNPKIKKRKKSPCHCPTKKVKRKKR
ncbi:MAG: hypothetical protein PHP00_11165 [Thiotrichaceae bacterium]|nr:hypothetical protein [Thiotrichaceae bacterium]